MSCLWRAPKLSDCNIHVISFLVKNKENKKLFFKQKPFFSSNFHFRERKNKKLKNEVPSLIYFGLGLSPWARGLGPVDDPSARNEQNWLILQRDDLALDPDPKVANDHLR